MKKKGLKKKIIIGIVAILILVIGIVIGRLTKKTNSIGFDKVESTISSQVVETDVETQTIQNTITSSGEIQSGGTEKIGLNTARYFEQLCVEEGDIVKAGENILEYTNSTYLTADYDCLISSCSVPSVDGKCTSGNYIEVENMNELTMTLSVDESDINSVKVGQEVEIEVNAISDKKYSGTISKIDSIGTYSSSGTTFTATVKFENDGDVKIGMSASCTVVVEEAKDCAAVKIAAVQTSGDRKYVVVVNDDGTTNEVDVETGISNDTYVQILSGVSVGQKVQMVEITTSNSSGRGNQMNFNFSSGGDKMQMMDRQQSGTTSGSSSSKGTRASAQ